MNRIIYTAYVVVACLMFAVIFFTSQQRRLLIGADFRAFYTGARMMVYKPSKSDFYNLATQLHWQQTFAPEISKKEDLLPLLEPPYVAVLFSPLGFFSFRDAYIIWAVGNTFFLTAIFFLVQRILKDAGWKIQLYVLCLLVSFAPFWITLLQGQLSLLFTLMLLVGWMLLQSKQYIIAGLAFSVLLIKPQLTLVILLVLIYQRQKKALIGFLIGLFVALLLALAFFGIDGMVEYSKTLTNIFHTDNFPSINSQWMTTWKGFLHLLYQTDKTAIIFPLWISGVIGAIGLLLLAWHKKMRETQKNLALRWALVIVVTIFISPHAHFHDLSIVMVAGILMIYAATISRDGSKDMLMWLPAMLNVAASLNIIIASFTHVQPVVLTLLCMIWVLSVKVYQEKSARV